MQVNYYHENQRAVQPPCCLAGPLEPPCEHWRAFERQLILAHCRGRLIELAERVILDLLRDNLPVDAGTIALEMARRVASARPQSLYLPWGINMAIADRIIEAVAADLAAKRRAA